MPERASPMRHAARLGLGMALSRCLGLVRDVLLAAILGGGAASDAFVLAFRLPNLARRLAAEGNFSTELVPACLASAGETQAPDRLFRAFFLLMLTLGLALALLAALFARPLVGLLAPGWTGDPEGGNAAVLLAVMGGYLPFCLAAAACCGLLMARNAFGLPSAFSALFNMALIVPALALLFFASPAALAASCLALAVVAAGALQLALALWALARTGFRLTGKVGRPDLARAARVLAATPAALMAGSGHMIGMLILTALASFLPLGSVSALYFAERLVELPLGLLGAALAMAVQPQLARMRSQQELVARTAMLTDTLRLCLFLALPAALGLFLLAHPLADAVFSHGNFAASTTAMTGGVLRAFALAMPALAVLRILVAALGCEVRTRLGRIALVQLLVLIVSGLVLTHFGRVDILALSLPLSAWTACLTAGHILYRQGLRIRSICPASALPALLVMGLTVTACLRLPFGPLCLSVSAVAAGVMVYLACARLLGNAEAVMLLGAMGKLYRSEPGTGPDKG